MSERIKLGSVLKVIHGYAFKSENYVDKSQYRLITLGNFEEGNNSFKFNDAKATYYGAEFPEEFIIHAGDLIMPLTEQVIGLFGNSAFVPATNEYTFVLNQRVGKIVCDETKVDSKYIHYLLATDSVKNQLEARASGTRQRNISPDDVYDVDVFLPDIITQQTIGEILFNIEQKQSNNNAICSDLESMAKLLYDYWFVQFDFPDENGKPYKSSGGKMVWNRILKREIPSGWENGVLSDVMEKYNNSIFPDMIGELPYTPMDILPMRKMSFFETGSQNDANSSLICYDKYSILFGAMRPYFHRVCIAPFDGVTRTTVFTIHERFTDELGYAYETLNQDYVVDYANTHHVGTQQPYAEWDNNLEKCPIPIPPHHLRKKYSEAILPLINTVVNNNLENQQLSLLRNYLLPMLMNGQVNVEKEGT